MIEDPLVTVEEARAVERLAQQPHGGNRGCAPAILAALAAWGVIALAVWGWVAA